MRFILVHGSFHGAWCWEPVLSLLRDRGHDAVAVDLPGRGSNPAPIQGRTLASYAETVAAELRREPAVVVGHSMGGVVVSQAAEFIPEMVRRLIYVCGFLPRDGQRLLDLATTDTESLILPALFIDEAAGVHSVRPEAHRAVFYGDCPEEVALAASARLIPEALAPVATPVHLSPDRFGQVPRTYIRTTLDACLTPALQDRMLAASPCSSVFELATDHSPFLGRPRELVDILIAAAG